MTVKDLILAHTADEVYGVFREMFLSTKEYDVSAAERAQKNFCDFFNKLKEIDPITDDSVILVYMYHDGDDAYLSATMFKKKDVSKDRLNSSPLKGISVADADSIPIADIERIGSNTGLPDAYGFEFSPWEVTLGADVSVFNIRSAGALRVLCAILYEMSFFGYDEESVDVERQKLREAIDEADNIMALPPEEREKHFKSVDEVFSEWGIEDDRTEEEKEADRENMFREGFRTIIEEYKALKAYCDEHDI